MRDATACPDSPILIMGEVKLYFLYRTIKYNTILETGNIDYADLRGSIVTFRGEHEEVQTDANRTRYSSRSLF